MTEVISIKSKIVSQSVVKDAPVEDTSIELMNEGIARPEVLRGSSYKIKPPASENSLYITINDIVLNEGTDHEVVQPYEMFINSKSMEHYQWVVALTRVISACFRKGGDVTFLVEELASVYDPNGGYFKKGGVFMPSLVAEIGSIVKKHMEFIGLIETNQPLSEETQQVIKEKRKKLGVEWGNFPESATVCSKCSTKAVVLMDGCQTCLNCGDGKCG